MSTVSDWMCCSDLTLEAGAEAPYWARRSAGDTLGAWKVDDPEGVVLLLVSELVTNAVAVSGAGEPVRVRLVRLEDRVRVSVWDRCSHVPLVRAAALDDEDGRGLWLVETLSVAWGWMLEPSGGKFVWCEYLCDQWP